MFKKLVKRQNNTDSGSALLQTTASVSSPDILAASDKGNDSEITPRMELVADENSLISKATSSSILSSILHPSFSKKSASKINIDRSKSSSFLEKELNGPQASFKRMSRDIQETSQLESPLSNSQSTTSINESRGRKLFQPERPRSVLGGMNLLRKQSLASPSIDNVAEETIAVDGSREYLFTRLTQELAQEMSMTDFNSVNLKGTLIIIPGIKTV